MPWRCETVMDLRIEFVVQAKKKETSMSKLCKQFGISRPTGYLWLRRYEQARSVTALAELSRRPLSSPAKTDPSLESRICHIRQQKGWGARKIKVLLGDETISTPTIHRVLVRGGLVSADPARQEATLRFEREQSNELAQMDFKGEYLVRGGKCYPLSFIDDHSRYLLGFWPLQSTRSEGVYRRLKQHFLQEGMPQAILTDHGTSWYSTTNGHGLTWLGVWLIKQGVEIHYSGIGHPQTQGKVERFHRTLNERTRHRGLPLTMSEWRKWAEEFRKEYNEERPHEALGMKTPAQVYKRENLRQYQENPRDWEYGDGKVERLNTQGSLKYGGRRYFVCEALAQERVRVDEVEGKLVVTFRQMTVREIDQRSGSSKAVLLPARSAKTILKVEAKV
jgi:transposase InsO family protein